MDKLLRERKSLDARLHRASENVRSLQCSKDSDDVDIVTALDNVQEIWASYLLVHKLMMNKCNDEEMDEILKHQATFEGNFIDVKNTLLKLKKIWNSSTVQQDESPLQDTSYTIQRLAEQQADFIRLVSANFSASASGNRDVVSPNASPSTDVKLPRMTLPIFDGNILEWPSFFDLFESAVHRNTNLSNSQKLYFLKTNLTGEAASLISHLTIEDANYSPALVKLKARYNKPLAIVAEHIHRFLSQPSMTSPSAAGLRSLHDISDEVIRALAVMDQEGRDVWLVHILVEKLDPETKQLWYQKVAEFKDEEVTLQKFLKFADTQSSALKSAQTTHPKQTTTTLQATNTSSPRRVTSLIATNNQRSSSSCSCCHRSLHQLYQCGKFRHLSVDDRLLFIRRHNRCKNCLRYHLGKPCRSGNCRKCGSAHHTLLHDALQAPVSPTLVRRATAANGSSSPTVSKALISPLSRTSDFTDTNVLLLTATVKVFDNFGRPHTCRAILDSASHSSYITAKLCRKLGLTTTEVDFAFEGITGSAGHANRGAMVTFASRCSDYQSTVPCIILERLSSRIPTNFIDCTKWPIPKSIHLADPEFNHPGDIDLLLGSKLFFQLLEPGTIRMGSDDSLPILQNTKLGWVVSGGFDNSSEQPSLDKGGHIKVGGRRIDATSSLESPEGTLVGGLCTRHFYGRSSSG